METWLLDTGPIVAYLDARDRAHEHVAATLEAFSGRLITTSAVVVEAMHFLGECRGGPALLVDFFLASQAEIHECSALEDLTKAVELMVKYEDTPMDFADATLVLLGAHLKVYDICTLDRRGFRTFRAPPKQAFNLVLDA